MNDYKTRVKNLRRLVREAKARGEVIPESVLEEARAGRPLTYKLTKAQLEQARADYLAATHA